MNEQICEKCQQAFFAQANPQLCNQCAELLFDKVKKYIQEYSYNSIGDIAENTGVAYKYLDQWIKQGRLEVMSPDAIELRQKSLNFQKQVSQLNNENNSKNQDKLASEQESKFHFLNRHKR